ncbi:SusC/RagA family TonB-linked outer membrane protein [Flexithrix dorotheae]|uniref:SusC/RagA family TonB-linked outer membrane protein n=1 Tax=Flexithrix dorotheae TaxID=70993 RepID=UPI00036168D5|nr:TonB-dependent receptor [Flexithrix dorotheae]
MKMKLIGLDYIKKMSKLLFYGIVFQAFSVSMLIASSGEAQKYRKISEVDLTVGFEESNLITVFKKIEEQSEFRFFFYSNELPDTKITLATEKRSLEQTLLSIGKKARLNFKRVNNNISVSTRPKLDIKQKLIIEEFVTLQSIIKGKVTDDSGLGLPGVNVLLKGSTLGTVTDINGDYSLSVEDNNAILVFSFIGYEAQEIPINGQSRIDISMAQDVKQLSEIIVIGYDAIKKSDLTGSVSSVSPQELTAYPTQSAVSALQGRAAGVQVESNNGGEPGAGYKIRIRGSTSINASSDPLFVVDGFVGGILPSPEDIASIEVLKDASATAIYGSRGANGVVMVTTKRGASGKTRIEFGSAFSTQKEVGRMDMLNRAQFLDLMDEATGGAYVPGPEGVDTDWQSEVLQPGFTQNYSLSFAGGTDNVNYYISGTYYDQKGIILSSNYDRMSIVSNIDLKASKKLNIGLNLIAFYTRKDGAPTQTGAHGGAFPGAYFMGPDVPIYNPDGSFALARIPTPYDNPYAATTQEIRDSREDKLQSNFYAEYALLKDFSFKTTIGLNSSNNGYGQYTPTTLLDGYNKGGVAQVTSSRNLSVLNENYFTYKKSFGGNNFSAVAGYSYQKIKNERVSAGAQGFVSDLFTYNNLAAGTTQLIPQSGLTEQIISSFFGRLNFGLSDRFLFTFTGRYDGSSVFSEGNKWAFFPSGAVAWNIGNENFLENSSTVTDLKLRASYGQTGNQAVSPYQTFAALKPILTIVDGKQVNGLIPSAISNDELTWETTTQLDFGVDLGLWENRINVTFDVYAMETEGLLFQIDLPSYSGFPSQLQNIGKMSNKGVELSIGADILTGKFDWNTSFNISANRNKITELPDHSDQFYGFGPGHLELRDPNILREGEPLGSYYGYIFEGVYQEGEEFLQGGNQREGEAKYTDINNDGIFNFDDRTIIGDPNPDYIWGWTNDFKYKNFDLNFFIQSSVGNDKFSYTLLEANTFYGQNNASTLALERWTPTNKSSNIPRAQNGGNRKFSSRFVYDGGYIRLKNIALGYNFPAIAKLNIKKLRLYVSAQNLFTITDYPGVDPENAYKTNNSIQDRNGTLGFDYGSYPTTKSFTVGLNVGF